MRGQKSVGRVRYIYMLLINASAVTRSTWCIHLLRDWGSSLTALISEYYLHFLGVVV